MFDVTEQIEKTIQELDRVSETADPTNEQLVLEVAKARMGLALSIAQLKASGYSI